MPIFGILQLKNLEKSYIGKHLPYPFTFDITIRKQAGETKIIILIEKLIIQLLCKINNFL